MSNIYSCERNIIDLNAVDMFSIESFATLQKISGNKIDEKRKMIRDMTLIEFDVCSRNEAMYSGKDIVAAIDGSVYIQELVQRGTWFGELDHPDPGCSRERFLRVDKDNISHRIGRYSHNSERMIGDVYLVAPKGHIPWDWIQSGSNLSLSVRVLTPNYKEMTDEQTGRPYVYKYGPMRMVCFDMISSAPGFKSASIISDVDSYNAAAADVSAENWKGINAKWTAGRKKEEFLHLLKSQESLPILQDVYGFDISKADKISYSQEGLISIVTKKTSEYSQTINIPTNVYKVNQVLGAGK